ncbi:hypothetical protein HYPBUDRAFT_108000 [Hyphopichia burtonii NRRL Y-1933]|uniref:Uncharacterized protein n=1 Tax=Hyphopichia burtonii NRRL Y-1933 TaxID=984485 RepID=A0A1E4RKK1_9ASCO|nr:hypothetical protein HYPBUDRAFT_108000 [Hyphopichia burtonii NRRL Y-1933]ODV67731.1 hypothetical protein HYPBUDRAFT_108000 [Hyphopichia burtonii NRRL Y-1933]
MNNQLLVNNTFKIYKSNAVPQAKFPLQSLNSLLRQQGLYLYEKYQSSNHDLIPKYTNLSDLIKVMKITNRHVQVKDYSINVIMIKSSPIIPNQLILFILKLNSDFKNFNTVILIKSSIPAFLVQSLEASLSRISVPLIIKDVQLTNHSIEAIINNFTASLNDHDGTKIAKLFGDLEIIYSTPLKMESLKTISILIPISNLEKLVMANDQQLKLIDLINHFLFNTTKLVFANLHMARFRSRLLDLSADGKFKIHPENLHLFNNSFSLNNEDSDDQDELDSFVWFVMASVYDCI